MLTYRDELCLYHHGVKGQKWGVRRYQNTDGTLTAAGRKRYYSQKQASEFANKLHDKAKKIEPSITKDVLRAIQSSGALPYGLNNRLKTKESLSRKILTDSKEQNASIEDVAKSINDSLRYTSVAIDKKFVSAYNSVKNYLTENGYAEKKCKNYFDLYRQGKAKHKQITSVYADRDGNLFEIQFLTPSALAAKELKTPLYEEVRNPNVTEARKAEIVAEMEKLASTVPDPVDVYQIRSHS